MASLEEISLYSGKVKLLFDPVRHVYMYNDKRVDGVTSILGCIAKPALINWAAKQASEYLKENLVPGRAYDEIELSRFFQEASKAHQYKKEKAGTIGTFVHEWIERRIAAGHSIPFPINEEIKAGCEAFEQWLSENHVEFLSSELRIFSLKYMYAGTLDFTARVNGKLMLGDIKTSSGVYPEMFFQTAAYQMAQEEENPNQIFEGNIIVNCRKDGKLVVKQTDQYDADSRAFLAALALHRRLLEIGSRS